MPWNRAVVMGLLVGTTLLGLTRLLPHGHAEAFAPIATPTASPKPPLSLPIVELNSPNQDDRPSGSPIDMIVIHDTETPPGIRKAQTVANHFLNPRSHASSHYVIGKAGEILQLVPDEKRAWHAGPSHFAGRTKINDFAIGIELVNTDTGRDPFTDAQYASLILLTADLVSRHHIPFEGITGHKNITDYPAYRKDPANNFDWKRYLDGVRQTLDTHTVQRAIADTGTPRRAAARRLGKSAG